MQALERGQTIGRYRIVAHLASGGMGTVYLARGIDEGSGGGVVAIKVLRPDLAGDDHFRAMFLDEVRIARAIRHTHVVRVLEVAEESGYLYCAMEYVDGHSAHEVVRAVERKGQRLPAALAVRIVADACEGLHAAHELHDEAGVWLEVVHRDVSPHNLLVSVDGIVKVIDFGVAKARQRLARDTTVATLKGKARYMAPEQVRGEPLDRRADIWALGIVAYRLLSGTLPYDGDNDLAVLRAILDRRAVPPLPAFVPAPIARAVRRMVALKPEDRPDNAATARDLLEHAMRESRLAASTEDLARYVHAHVGDICATRRKRIAALLFDDEPVARTSEGAVFQRRGGELASTFEPVQLDIPLAAPGAGAGGSTNASAAAPHPMKIDTATEVMPVPVCMSDGSPMDRAPDGVDREARRFRRARRAALRAVFAAGAVMATLAPLAAEDIARLLSMGDGYDPATLASSADEGGVTRGFERIAGALRRGAASEPADHPGATRSAGTLAGSIVIDTGIETPAESGPTAQAAERGHRPPPIAAADGRHAPSPMTASSSHTPTREDRPRRTRETRRVTGSDPTSR
jgi:serine/threonine-protein kinase